MMSLPAGSLSHVLSGKESLCAWSHVPSGGLPPGGSLPGGLCWMSLLKDLYQGGSLSGGLCPWGLCPGGMHPNGIFYVLVSVKNTLPFSF